MWTRVAVLDVDASRIGITWAAHDRLADDAYVYDCVVTPLRDPVADRSHIAWRGQSRVRLSEIARRRMV